MKTQVWAHRGASAYAPENTMEAFRLAKEQGADGIEIDVQMTKDKELVVIHDETIDRTSLGSGFVKDLTYSELLEINFNQLHPEYPTAKLPLLEEVFAFVKESKMMINVELKNSVIPYPKLEERVCKLARQMGVEDKVLYSSFNHGSLRKLQKIDPEAVTGILYADGWLKVPTYAQNLGVQAIHPAWYHVKNDTKLIEKSHRKGLKVHVWTVNRKEDMEELLHLGVDAIITNYPDICRRAVAKQKN
ncbi:MAG: glycerophosphodiester phosphodiesterase [bacterium]|nr:glycerophosphodiester phosphodiesterase [bacterium]